MITGKCREMKMRRVTAVTTPAAEIKNSIVADDVSESARFDIRSTINPVPVKRQLTGRFVISVSQTDA